MFSLSILLQIYMETPDSILTMSIKWLLTKRSSAYLVLLMRDAYVIHAQSGQLYIQVCFTMNISKTCLIPSIACLPTTKEMHKRYC